MQIDKTVSWTVIWLPTTHGVNVKTVPWKHNTHLPSHLQGICSHVTISELSHKEDEVHTALQAIT